MTISFNKIKLNIIYPLIFLLFKLLFNRHNEKNILKYFYLGQTGGINNILIIRAGYLGDMVVFLPTLAAIRQALPNATITVVTSEPGQEIIKLSGLLIRTIVYGMNEFSAEKRTKKINFIYQLRKRHFDMVICTTYELQIWYGLLAYFSAAKVKVGFERAEGDFFYNVKIPSSHSEHEINKNLRILNKLGIEALEQNPKMKIPQEAESALERILEENHLDNTEPLIGIHVKGKLYTRSWLPENFAKVADFFVEKYKASVVFTGSIQDKQSISAIMKIMKAKALDMSGLINIAQLSSLIKRLDLFLTIDSGPMHLARYMETPTVALFGPGEYKRWGYPDSKNFITLRKEISCNPCLKDFCDSHACMKNIKVEEVISCADKLISVGSLVSSGKKN